VIGDVRGPEYFNIKPHPNTPRRSVKCIDFVSDKRKKNSWIWNKAFNKSWKEEDFRHRYYYCVFPVTLQVAWKFCVLQRDRPPYDRPNSRGHTPAKNYDTLYEKQSSSCKLLLLPVTLTQEPSLRHKWREKLFRFNFKFQTGWTIELQWKRYKS
jgi:hypothetical protein